MNAIEFVKASRRMVKLGLITDDVDLPAEVLVAKVELWLEKHETRTKKIEFLEHYPNAYIDPITDTLRIYPCSVDTSLKPNFCEKHQTCYDCRVAYWQQEVD